MPRVDKCAGHQQRAVKRLPRASQADDERTLAALRRKDEQAFVQLVSALGPSMIRIARLYVPHQGVAEEIVQEAWLSVLRGLDGFQGRSSLRTWIFAVLANCARKRAAKEGHAVSLSAIGGVTEADERDDRFFPSTHPRWAGMWTSVVDPWDELPEERLLAGEVVAVMRDAIAELPTAQRLVLGLRDVEGWSASETAELLGLSDPNQRVLLHRARGTVRRVLELYLDRERSG